MFDEAVEIKQSQRSMQVTQILALSILGSVLTQAQPSPAPGTPTAPAPQTAPPAAPLAPVITVPPQTGSSAAITQTNTQTVAINTRSLSLQEAIDQALQHNFDVQITRYLPQLARFNLQADWGAYDPVLTASGQHGYSLSPGGLNPYGNQFFQGNETETDSFNTGLTGLLPWGMTYSLIGNASEAYGTTPGALPDERRPFDNSSANAAASQLRQPLLKNFWIDPTRATILIAKNRLKYSEFTTILQLMTTVEAVEESYYNLIFARENVRVLETALQLAERLLWENRKKVEVGQLAPLDEKQAQSQAAARRADLIASQQALETQENVLKSLITDNYISLHNVRLIPAETLVAVPAILDLQESWIRASQKRPDLQQARLDVQRNQITVRLDKNQLFPQLDLVGQYGYAGNGREFSGAIGEVRDRSNPYWYYGAQLSYPIGNRTARANYKAAKAQKEQTELVLKQKEQNVQISVDNAVKVVQTGFARVEATREAESFAEAALEAEQKKLENGKSTSFNVLEFQNELTTARFNRIQALAQYNIALAQLAFQEGTTLERHHLNVQVK